MLLPRGTTGFALDATTPQVLVAKIMGRKCTDQNVIEDVGTRGRLDQEDTIGVCDDRDRISMADFQPEARREIVEPKDRKAMRDMEV